ncbi:MAG TPA: hypothetical protein DEV63_14730, partial [Algoriphagus sp.]|nr:hypothetical protein [Algoriphagus sp.]
GSESGSFACLPRLGLPCLPVGRGHRSPVLSEVEVSNQSSKENKATGMIADNQILFFIKIDIQRFIIYIL